MSPIHVVERCHYPGAWCSRVACESRSCSWVRSGRLEAGRPALEAAGCRQVTAQTGQVALRCVDESPAVVGLYTRTRVTCLLRTERSCEAQGSSPRGERGWGACATRTAFHTDVPHTTGTAALTNRAFTRLPLRRWTLRSGVRARRGPFRSAHTQYRCPTQHTAPLTHLDLISRAQLLAYHKTLEVTVAEKEKVSRATTSLPPISPALHRPRHPRHRRRLS